MFSKAAKSHSIKLPDEEKLSKMKETVERTEGKTNLIYFNVWIPFINTVIKSCS